MMMAEVQGANKHHVVGGHSHAGESADVGNFVLHDEAIPHRTVPYQIADLKKSTFPMSRRKSAIGGGMQCHAHSSLAGLVMPRNAMVRARKSHWVVATGPSEHRMLRLDATIAING